MEGIEEERERGMEGEGCEGGGLRKSGWDKEGERERVKENGETREQMRGT